jgi:uncharacterized protein
LVSNKLPSREQALQILRQSECHPKIIMHCKAVAKLALRTANTLKKKNLKVNLELVEIGALLHDIGRSKTHTIHHAVIGAELAEALGISEQVISIIKRHVGGGITASEAKKLGWPEDLYTPITIEEKIVSYADKLIVNSKQAPIEITLQKLIEEGKSDAADRVLRNHKEIENLIGDLP